MKLLLTTLAAITGFLIGYYLSAALTEFLIDCYSLEVTGICI